MTICTFVRVFRSYHCCQICLFLLFFPLGWHKSSSPLLSIDNKYKLKLTLVNMALEDCMHWQEMCNTNLSMAFSFLVCRCRLAWTAPWCMSPMNMKYMVSCNFIGIITIHDNVIFWCKRAIRWIEEEGKDEWIDKLMSDVVHDYGCVHYCILKIRQCNDCNGKSK